PAHIYFRCCGLGGWRQVRRKDLLWLAGPALSADRGAALVDGDEATVGPPAVVIDSTPFIWISKGRPDREEHRYGSHNSDNDSNKCFAHEHHPKNNSKEIYAHAAIASVLLYSKLRAGEFLDCEAYLAACADAVGGVSITCHFVNHYFLITQQRQR